MWYVSFSYIYATKGETVYSVILENLAPNLGVNIISSFRVRLFSIKMSLSKFSLTLKRSTFRVSMMAASEGCIREVDAAQRAHSLINTISASPRACGIEIIQLRRQYMTFPLD
jgi:hypothetical protein